MPVTAPMTLPPVARCTPVALAVWAMCSSLATLAQTAPESVVKIKPSLVLKDLYTAEEKKQMPTFVYGQTITGRPDIDLVVDGEAEMRRAGSVIRADRIEYYQPEDRARALGGVRVNREGNVYAGPEAQFKLDANEGYFLSPKFELIKNGGHGQASRIDFLDDKRSALRDVIYSTCRAANGEPAKKPDWQLSATQLRIDDDTEEGQASNAVIRFKGVPLLAAPVLSFATENGRKSGWLPPTINFDNLSGAEVMVPYYFNLAPNRDATLYTSVMSKRGVNVGNEFRYLENSYRGNMRLDWMPYDKLSGSSRWGLTAQHTGSAFGGTSPWGYVSIAANLNRVSDDNYWREFPRTVGALTQRLLSNDLNLSWSRSFYSLTLRTQKWQTLQDSAAPITPPYDRLPQLTGRYQRSNVNGFDYQITADTTRFVADSSLTLQPNAQRTYAQASVGYPFISPGSFIRPKISLHTTAYNFDTAPSSGLYANTQNATRAVPTFSVDSGLIFERDYSLLGQKLTQTLEPRAFYTYTPYRNQNAIPLYDTGATDFNFTSIFSDNAFTGNDRISDNNLLTLGLTSRLFNANGAETLRLNFAQRLRLRDQRVTLPGGVSDTSRLSDQLFGATVNWSPAWTLDTTVQYNPKTSQSQRTTFNARYSPSLYRTVSTNYVFNRGSSQQFDVGWQWPLNDLWGSRGQDLGRGQGQGAGRLYSVGRLNYNMLDKKLVDAVLGFEYDEGCWLARVVMEKLQTTTSTANKRIMFQLELVGLGRVGTNPLSVLRTYVPRYQLLREKINTSPSRFSNYD